MTIQEIYHIEIISNELKSISEWIDTNEFSIDEYYDKCRQLTDIENTISTLKEKLNRRKKDIDCEDWRLFIKTLTMLLRLLRL